MILGIIHSRVFLSAELSRRRSRLAEPGWLLL